MQPVLVGLSHKTAPVEVRERIAINEDLIPAAIKILLQKHQLRESMILSTCNRVEILGQGQNQKETIEKIILFLHSYHSLPSNFLEPYLYTLQNEEAVLHVFRVASSLDSMVLGESQILGQLKQAYAVAGGAKGTGPTLQILLPTAFRVAKRIRTETGISESAVSISSVAVELAKKIFGTLQGKSILLLGAGKMSELATRSLLQSGIANVYVASRTDARSRILAKSFGGIPIQMATIQDHLPECDILLVSTSATSFILDPEMMHRVVRRRKYAPLFVIDISVPRNVDPRINEIENVFLYDIDDLQSVIDANLKERKREAELAEGLVQEETKRHLQRMNSLDLGPIIANLRTRIEEICLTQLEKNRKTMKASDFSRMEKLLRKTAHRIAHPIIMQIKTPAQDPLQRLHNIEMLKQAFDLEKIE